MPITIVTVHHDTPRYIDLCIRAVKLFSTGDYKHVVVDNGSSLATVACLEQFARQGWITLYKRLVPKLSGLHGGSIDWFLQTNRNHDLICLLDSDAHPTRPDWLDFLRTNLGEAAATGFAHFRDEQLIHPACMLFRYSAFVAAGRPSFRLRSHPLIDTAIVVCQAMRAAHQQLKPIPAPVLTEYVRHRWCATRVNSVPGTHIDDISKEMYFRESEDWFNQAIVDHIINATNSL